ncbi:MAG TPA: WD40 repeat domain-containing protein [Pseudomonadota bacterium]|nr:WD40 repeat domain-containing protein [Pseudomonadota bacterium]
MAGALPKLQQQDPRLRLLRMRPGGDPSGALQRLLHSHPADDPALLFVDQFEEIFTQTTDAAVRQAFVRRLWGLAGQATPVVSVLLTLRVDFLGRCGELSLDDAGLRLDQVAYAEAHRVFIAGLAREPLRRAIEGPAHVVGLQLQDGLVERMLDDVGGEPGALPPLQDALDVLWQHRSGDTLSQSAYLALGGVVGALQRRADDLLNSLSAAEQGIAQRILISLVSLSEDTTLDTRRRVPVTELRQSVAASDGEGFERVLQSFVRERLLVQGGDEGRVTVEVAHEALIRKWPRLRGWLNESRAGLLVQRRIGQAAQEWLTQSEDESLLYRGTQLAQASEWRKTWAGQLGEPAQRFLDASEARKTREDAQAEAQRQKERTRARQTLVAAVVLGALFIVALFASGVAYLNGLMAKENAAKAQGLLDRNRASLFLALAQNERDDPTMAAALLREANLPSSPLWMQLALGVLQSQIATVVLRQHSADVRAIAVSRDGRLLATAGQDLLGQRRCHGADLAGRRPSKEGLGLSLRLGGARGGGEPRWNPDRIGP